MAVQIKSTQFYCCLRSVMPSSIVNSMWGCCCGGIFELRGGIPQNISDRELGTSDLFRNTALEKQNIDHITYHRFNTNTSFGIDPPLLVYRGDYFGRTPNLEINWNNLKTILEFALVWEFSSIIHSKCQYQVKLHCCKSVNQQLALDAEWEG